MPGRPKKGPRFGGSASHQKAMMANLVASLIAAEAITTTEAKAKAMRPIIDNGMRSGITDTAMRARTITIYQNASVVNNPLGFSGRGTIRVLVVRRDGTVLLSTSGAVTSDGVKAVQAAYQN